ncbi:cytidine deaminase-like protein [Whalleya microplaca]|nr:cytidine deaminase-like protein [Whalleya microplaca]
MLIGICGAKCAGKSTVAQYLIDHHGFKKLHIERTPLEHGATSDIPKTEPSTSASAVPESHTQSLSVHLKPAAASSHVFPTATALLNFVTKHWQWRWVTTDIHDEDVLNTLSRRPFFILISVDSPVTMRWRRYQERRASQATSTNSSSSTEPISLESFVSASDAHLYSPTSGALPVMSRATIRLLNTSTSLAHLYASLGKLDLTNPDRLRPSWDSYFMSLASLAAQRCNCMKRAVGCVLVDARHHVVSTGYNGTPRHLRNCGEGGCPRCNSGDSTSGAALATCLCLHAEENALLEAGRERIREGSVLYCNTCPCLTCSIKIVQVGIGEVVYNQGYSMDGEAAQVFRTAGVELRQFSPPANGLIHLEKMELY